MLSRIKTLCLTTAFASLSISILPAYAEGTNIIVNDEAVKNLQAGFGQNKLEEMIIPPIDQDLTRATNLAQGAYLLSPSALPVGSLTRDLLETIASGLSSGDNAQYSLLWQPGPSSINKLLTKSPLDAVNVNSLLEPLVYNQEEDAQAKSVLNALSVNLSPLHALDFNTLVANLSGDKTSNLKVKLNEKDVQDYLATLRNYLAVQSIALGNLSQLYAERQEISDKQLSQLPEETIKAVETFKRPISALKLENFMATRRILDKKWYDHLIKENPATLQREQTQLLAENLAQSYQMRMTLERLLATMSVLVLELNAQTRGQLQGQIEKINHPSQS
jgi:hypothetical protein